MEEILTQERVDEKSHFNLQNNLLKGHVKIVLKKSII